MMVRISMQYSSVTSDFWRSVKVSRITAKLPISSFMVQTWTQSGIPFESGRSIFIFSNAFALFAAKTKPCGISVLESQLLKVSKRLFISLTVLKHYTGTHVGHKHSPPKHLYYQGTIYVCRVTHRIYRYNEYLMETTLAPDCSTLNYLRSIVQSGMIDKKYVPILTGWTRVQSKTLTNCFSAAA